MPFDVRPNSARAISAQWLLRSFRSPTLLSAAWVVIGLGVLALLGIATPGGRLARPFPHFPAPHLGSVTGVLLLGVGLLGRALGRKWLLLFGGSAAALLSAASFVLQLVPQSPEARASIGPISASYLPLPMVSGICVLLVAIGLLAPTLLTKHRQQSHIITGVCGSTVALLATVLLLGRLSGFLDGTDGSTLIGASPYELCALLVLGASLIRMATGLEQSAAPRVGSWLPVAAGVATLVTVIFVWRALIAREHDRMLQQIDVASHVAASDVRYELLRLSNGLERLGRRSGSPGAERDSLLIALLEGILPDTMQALRGAAWQIGAGATDRSPIIVVPSGHGDAAALTALVQRQNAAPRASPGARTPNVHFLAVPGGGESFAVSVEMCAQAPCTPTLIGVYDARRVFRSLLADTLSGFYAAVRLDSTRIVRSGLSSRADPAFLRSVDIDLPNSGTRWQITVWPTPLTLERAKSDLPDAVLILGLTLAMLLPLTLRLAESSWGTAARTERERLNRALESATDSLWVWNVAAHTIERSDVLWRRLGYPPPTGAVSIDTWLELVHPKDAPEVQRIMSRHAAGITESMEMEFRARSADGAWHWLVERGRVVERSDTGQALRALGVTADVTDRKNADAALEASERKYRAMFDSASQMLAQLDDQGRVVEMNPAGLVRNGVGRSGLAGQPVWEIPAFRDSNAMREALTKACERGRSQQRTSVVVSEKNGKIGGIAWDLSITPITDAQGTVRHLLMDVRDISERQSAERALIELNNLASMGRLTARVAHEINNPLAGIQNSFRLIRGAVPEDHPHYRFVGAIDREIARIAAVTRQLYETYRHEPETSASASVETVVSDAIAFIELVNRQSSVRIVVDLSAAPTTVPFPDALLRRVVYNLVQNAVDASPPDGTVHLTAFEDRGVFNLQVRDEGVGVAEALRGRIFEPFVSTKGAESTHSGMGLGLALVHGSVTAFGGRVSLHSAPEGGSMFEVSLPLTQPRDGAESNERWTNTTG
ncbi:MAG: PAS domain S-box protein [Gemmatimonadaceae bacterium]|nr:PAS domain S-box protein [Gemmatimonadaceae bacterium]